MIRRMIVQTLTVLALAAGWLGVASTSRADFSAFFQQNNNSGGGTNLFTDPGVAPNTLNPGNFTLGGTGVQISFTPGVSKLSSSYPTATSAAINVLQPITISNSGSLRSTHVRITLIETGFNLPAGNYTLASNLGITTANTSASGWTTTLWTTIANPSLTFPFPAIPTSPTASPLATVTTPGGTNSATGTFFHSGGAFTLYSVYTILLNGGAQVTINNGTGSGFTLLSAVPVPPGIALVLSGLPMLGLARFLRRKKA